MNSGSSVIARQLVDQRTAAIRAKLLRQRTRAPLFDGVRTTRPLEQAYRTMHERHRRGEPPAAFDVEPVVV